MPSVGGVEIVNPVNGLPSSSKPVKVGAKTLFMEFSGTVAESGSASGIITREVA